MTDDHLRLARLFQGRTDAWGAIHGQAVKLPLLPKDWDNHVNADGSVGVYPLVPRLGRDTYDAMYGDTSEVDSWVCRWGCVDIDNGYEASLPVARNLHAAYSVLGLTSWIERTKSKGYHCWLLASDWVPAVTMRNVQLLACALIEYAPREVNPKQTELADGQLGNYVNVPYAKKWCESPRGVPWTRLMLDPRQTDWFYGLQPFLDAAEANLNTPEKLGAVADLYKVPPAPRPACDWSGHRHVNYKPYLSPLTYKVLEEGPLPSLETGHIDRSAGLQKLAHLCAKDGLQPSETYAVVAEADVRWGKYSTRSDCELQLRKIVEKAYG